MPQLSCTDLALGYEGKTVVSGLSFTVNAGVLWLFAAVACFSSYNILQRRLAGKYTAIQKTSYSIFAATVMLCVFAPGAVSELRNSAAGA